MKRLSFIIFLICSMSCALAQEGGKALPSTDTLELVLEAGPFVAKSEEETVGNIKKFIDEVKRIRGLSGLNIISIADGNLRSSLTIKKADYKKPLDDQGVVELKRELESDPLVDQIWVWYAEIFIRLKRNVYDDEIKSFIERHPGLAPGFSIGAGEMQNIIVFLGGIPAGQSGKYKELIKNKFPDKIKRIE